MAMPTQYRVTGALRAQDVELRNEWNSNLFEKFNVSYAVDTDRIDRGEAIRLLSVAEAAIFSSAWPPFAGPNNVRIIMVKGDLMGSAQILINSDSSVTTHRARLNVWVPRDHPKELVLKAIATIREAILENIYPAF